MGLLLLPAITLVLVCGTVGWIASLSWKSFLIATVLSTGLLFWLWADEQIHDCQGNGTGRAVGIGLLMIVSMGLVSSLFFSGCLLVWKKKRITQGTLFKTVLALFLAILVMSWFVPWLKDIGPCGSVGG